MSLIFLDLLRWGARLSGLMVAVAYVALLLGEILFPHSGGPSLFREWLGLVLLSTSCLAILVAWRWQLLGGVLSLTALASFGLLVRINQPVLIAVVAIPGVLYVVDWLAHREAVQRSTT